MSVSVSRFGGEFGVGVSVARLSVWCRLALASPSPRVPRLRCAVVLCVCVWVLCGLRVLVVFAASGCHRRSSREHITDDATTQARSRRPLRGDRSMTGI